MVFNGVLKPFGFENEEWTTITTLHYTTKMKFTVGLNSVLKAKISKMVFHGVLKPFGVESTLKIFWENQNDLGQKFAKDCHYGIAFD